jgi:hypothetical protein
MSRSVRLLFAGGLAVIIVIAGLIAFVLPVATQRDAEPRITRLFIPAIKADCRERAQVPPDAVLGYTFSDTGALATIDIDGSLTGVEVDVLRRLNGCLAQYPIQPTVDLPQDHYHRNLLYDYYLTDLRPCLADRVTELPELPSRSDFVVRLFGWQPYRILARTLPLAQLLEYARACPEVPGWLVP